MASTRTSISVPKTALQESASAASQRISAIVALRITTSSAGVRMLPQRGCTSFGG